MTLRRIACLLLVLTFSIAANAGDRKFIVKPRSGDRKALPFSEAVLVGNTLYIAGHIGLDAKTDLPPASAEDEARLVMEGIKETVESAGMSMDDVVSMQIFCADLKLYDTFNAVYSTYFHGNCPARFLVDRLPLSKNRYRSTRTHSRLLCRRDGHWSGCFSGTWEAIGQAPSCDSHDG